MRNIANVFVLLQSARELVGTTRGATDRRRRTRRNVLEGSSQEEDGREGEVGEKQDEAGRTVHDVFRSIHTRDVTDSCFWQVAKVLDPKRSQAIGIFISSLHLSVADIETALLSFDGSLLPTDTLQSLFEQVRCRTSFQKLEERCAAKFPYFCSRSAQSRTS